MTNTENKPDLAKMYEEGSQMWRQFALRGERLLWGYVTSLAGLALAFHKVASHGPRLVVLAGGILASAVFLMFHYRTQAFANACQGLLARFEDGRGPFAALSTGHPARQRWTYGLAVNLLAGTVIGASSAGLYVGLLSGDFESVPVVVGALVGPLLGAGLAVRNRHRLSRPTKVGSDASLPQTGTARPIAKDAT